MIKKKWKLYISAKGKKGITILKEYQNLQNKFLLRNIIAIILQFCCFVISFYCSFGFCATYKYQSFTFLICFAFGLAIDCFILEFIYEIFIGFLFSIRKRGRFIITCAERLNSLRFIKLLI